MHHVCRIAFACLIVIPIGCDVPPEPFNWPSFDDKVIEVGRRVLKAQAEESSAAQTPPPTEPDAEGAVPDEPISATSEAVLQEVKIWVDVRGTRGQRALDAIHKLGSSAVDPLLEILADDSLPLRYTDRAVGLLIQPEHQHKDEADDSDSVVCLPPTNRIFDAVVDYLQRHPEAQASPGYLSGFTRLERIPKVIELIESTAGERQRPYIYLFNTLTYTSFPTMQYGFCGNSTPASIRRAVKAGEERQRESVGAIKTWWNEHKNESPDEWLKASVKRNIRDRAEHLKSWAATESDDKSERWAKNHSIREYYPRLWGRWLPSVFDTLLNEFGKAPEYAKPYILRMVASTRHPDAATFIASKLESTDPNIQHAAVAALRDLKVSDHNEAIGRILRSTKDQGLALEAIDALKELAGAGALEDFTYALDHPDSLVPERAARALKPYLVSHADRLGKIAQSHPSKEMRRKLGIMLDGAAAAALGKADAKETSVEERIVSTRALLRSDDPERQKRGISLAAGYPELLPDVLELIRSTDYRVRYNAVELIQQTGIPRLTVENAPRLMGYSSKLDRHVAAYCYAKYGRKAIPIVKRAAFNLDDPLKPGSKHVPSPAVGLIRALVQEKASGVERAVIRLVKDNRARSSYVELLKLLDDSKSASLVGEFLHHEERHCRLTAMRVVRARHLTQHADRLFELASFSFDQNEVDRLREELQKEKITSQEYNQRAGPIHDRPYDQHEATLALIDLDDPRAWQAVITCLEGKRLVWREQSLVSPTIVTTFGAMVAHLKTSHRDGIHVLLRRELSGENREHVVVSLTTALAMNPELADSDALWAVATTSHTHEQARILAAIALSKLDERRILPVLQELVRSFIAPERTARGRYPPGWLSAISPSMKSRMRNRRPSLLAFDFRRQVYLSTLEHHHLDLGLALRRLGDETLVDELVEALSDVRGDFSMSAYRFLGGIIGFRAYGYGREWIESQGFENPQFPAVLASMLLDLDVPPEDILALIVADDFQLRYKMHLFVSAQVTGAADAIFDAYHRLPKRSGDYAPIQMIEALCEFGDLRGIALAAKNPWLLASAVRYLPDAPGVDFPAGHFDYNRIEEAMAVQAWYEQHAGDLRWNPESSQFRLASHAP